MLPLVPFALGLLSGAAAVGLLRSDRSKAGFDKAKAGLGAARAQLRGAALSGLSAIEASSARARDRLSATGESETSVQPEVAAPAVEPTPAPRRKAASPRKRAPKTAAPKGEGAAS